VLLGADNFIYLVQRSGIRMLLRGTGFVSNAFVQDEKGVVWIGSQNRIFNYQNGELSISRGLQASGPDNALVEDRGHNLWLGTTIAGLYRLQGGQITSCNSPDGLTDNQVLSFYEDREGSLWVGTASGLDRFRNTNITTFTTKEGLPSNNTTSVLETQDGSIFVFCGSAGLARIKNGVVTRIGMKEGLPSAYGYAMFEGQEGSLWIGSRVGLSRYKNGKVTSYVEKGLFPNIFVSTINEDDESLLVTTSSP